MKPIQRLTLCTLFVLGSFSAHAYTFSAKNDDGKTIYYNVVSTSNLTCSATYRNTNYNSYSGSITIPQKVDYDSKTYTVVGIDSYAFYNCTGLTDVIIPNSVTSIGSSAFYNCSGLTGELVIPTNITSIGNSAFSGCSGLTSLTIEVGDESLSLSTSSSDTPFKNCPFETLYLGRDVSYSNYSSPFRGNAYLTSVTIGTNVASIIGDEFQGCSKLKEVTIMESEETLSSTISDYYRTPFTNCPIETLYLGRNLSYDGSYSPFKENTYLTSLTIGDKVTTISYYEFYSCSELREVTIPNSVTTLENYAFKNCTSLASLSLGNSVASIGSYTFDYCTSLTEVTIPYGVTSLNTFNYCTSLTEVTIPNSVTSLSGFEGCTSLTEVTIPNSVTSINSYAFYNCTSLASVNIPNSVTSIDGYAFDGCTSLTEVIIPASVESISRGAFDGCSNLETLILEGGEGVSDLSMNSYYSPEPFRYCPIKTLYLDRDLEYPTDFSPFKSLSSLTNLTIGNNVTTIGYGSFYSCVNLEEVSIPNNVTSIRYEAFQKCENLKTFIMEDGDEVLTFETYMYHYVSFKNCPIEKLYLGRNISYPSGSAPFAYVSTLNSLEISKNVISIGEGAFSSCSKLTELVIPSTVTSIGSGAFSNTGLVVLTLEDGEETLSLQTIYAFPSTLETLYVGRDISYSGSSYQSPFSGNVSLLSLTIGEQVKKISEYEFYNCSGLKEVTIPNNITSIGEYAFAECTNLEEITITDALTEITSHLFYNCASLNDVTIPNNVKNIGQHAFDGCIGLTDMTIPNNVSTIDDYAFYQCTSLESITLGNNVSTIGYATFYDCSNLRKITSLNATPPSIRSNTFSSGEQKECMLLEVPKESLILYALASYWNDIHIICADDNGKIYYPIPIIYEGTAIIAADGGDENGVIAMKGSTATISPINKNSQIYGTVVHETEDVTNKINNSGSFSFTVSENYKENRVYAYAIDATNTYDITLQQAGQLVDEISANNADNVYSLKITGDINGTDVLTIRKMTNLQILDLSSANVVSGGREYYEDCTTSNDKIGDNFFTGMTSLKYIKLPYAATSIGNYALYNCTGLTSVSIPSQVSSIADNAFSSCKNIIAVTLENGTKTLSVSPFNAFNSCPLVSLYIGRDLGASHTSVYSSSNKLSLTKLTIGEGVSKINNYYCEGCINLMRINIPNTVTSIGDNAFLNCCRLKELTIGNSVEAIGSTAFSGCSRLATIYSLNPTPPDIENDTFNDVDKKECTLYVPIGSLNAYWVHLYWGEFYDIREIDPTGISGINYGEAKIIDCYSVDGKKVNAPQKGINILHYSDGTTKKVLVK